MTPLTPLVYSCSGYTAQPRYLLSTYSAHFNSKITPYGTKHRVHTKNFRVY